MYHLLSVIFIFILSGCGVYSQYPLTPFDKDSLDTKIFGTWIWNEEESSEYIHLGIDEDTGLLKVLMIIMRKNGESVLLEFSGHTSKVAEDHYFNLKLIQPAQERFDEYMFFKYNVTPDTLSIGMMNSDIVAEAIINGTLKGWTSKKNFITSVYLNESEDKLHRFIETQGKELFPEIRTYKKVNVSKFKQNER